MTAGQPGDDNYRSLKLLDEHINFWSENGFLNIDVGTVLLDAGVLGTSDTPGLVGRDGETIFPDVESFAADWQVQPPADSLLFSVLGTPQYPDVCMLPEEEVEQGPVRLRGNA